MSSDTVILLTGILTATACALLGCFLILRKMAMMADAISHAILPGLVLGYFVAHGPNLLAGFAGAALAAVVTVTLVEALQNTRRVGSQAAIGLVFPAMFALGTFVVSKYFADVHLDTDAILYGNIEFASQDLLFIGHLNLGPQSLWVMGTLTLMNLLLVGLFYKELKLATFDPALAATLGFLPIMLHYAMMTAVSVTAVGAFTAVGAVLVVALFIVPAATAYLLTDRLPLMIGLSVGVGALAAVGGYGLALAMDASIAGAMATVAGVLFGVAWLFSPLHGLIARARRLDQQRATFNAETLIVHLHTHEATTRESEESAVAHLYEELRWTPRAATRAIGWASDRGWVQRTNGHLSLTAQGRQRAETLTA